MNISKIIDSIDLKKEALNNFLKALRADKSQTFYANDGCTTCMGRGKIVLGYDFLKPNIGACSNKNCTEASREVSGLHPKRVSDLDDALGHDWHSVMNDDELEKFKLMKNEIKQLKSKLDLVESLKVPQAGRVARVTKRGRVKNPPPVDTDVYIINTFVSSWDVSKAVVIDKECNVYYPSSNSLSVKTYVPKEEREDWEKVHSEHMMNVALPMICIIKRKTGKAVLLKTLTGIEFWAPKKQVKFDGEVKTNEVMSVHIPQWLAKKNNLISSK